MNVKDWKQGTDTPGHAKKSLYTTSWDRESVGINHSAYSIDYMSAL